MKKSALLLSTALLSSLVGLGLSEISSAAAASGLPCDLSLASGSVTVRSNNEFEFLLLLEWNTPTKPFMGQIVLKTRSQNVNAAVSISPEYIFPSSNQGAVLVKVKGQKSDRNAGYVELTGMIFANGPYWDIHRQEIPATP